MCGAMGTETELEFYHDPHRTGPNHTCMVEGEHYHRAGKYDTFFRPMTEVTTLSDELVPEEEPQMPTDKYPFNGFYCPVCELFGFEELEGLEKPLLSGEVEGYVCPRNHHVTHNEMSNWWARRQQKEGSPLVDHEWVAKVTTLLVDKQLHTFVIEIWKEIHRGSE